ncbi:hypothetical protein KSP40_PGU005039 [Platanthera guangdongensis]|uniref:Uncharacterized protein n=1 Tax=Platanthera guangdongensis TaxID=2320717 RepID=A0ABR2M1L5_9ASPA
MSQVVILLLGEGGAQIELTRPPFIMTPGKGCHNAFSSTASSSRATKHFLSNLVSRDDQGCPAGSHLPRTSAEEVPLRESPGF